MSATPDLNDKGEPLKVIFSVDVEEQGLFSGRYDRVPEVDNVLHLHRLEHITSSFDLPLTLLVTYPVIKDPACRDLLLRMQDENGAEIGVHLHPWNTPPFKNEGPDILNSAAMPRETLAAKLHTLTKAIAEATGKPPVSFRMGRFDFSDAVRDLLLPAGFKVDSSAIPLRDTPAGTKYFLGKTDPYHLPTAHGPILEAPPTMAQLIPGSARLTHRLITQGPRILGNASLKLFKTIGRVGAQPMSFPLASLKAAARLHHQRGGQVLTIYLHSSELTHGHHPRLPDDTAVAAYLEKIRSYLDWLSRQWEVQGITLENLPACMPEAPASSGRLP